MFFRVPPSSTPVTSSLVYTRKVGEINMSWTSAALCGFLPATTVAEGFSSAISLARLGPERTQMPSCISGGSTSSMTWLIRLPSGASSPLEALTTVASGLRCSPIHRMLRRNCSEGTASATRSAPPTVFSTSPSTARESGNRMPGSRRRFSRRRFSPSASSGVRARMVTGTPLRASVIPRVVPQVVVPTITTALVTGLLVPRRPAGSARKPWGA